MEWDIFWSAFGAIGTTIGSLITAGAVVVAVKQYMQPITKLIKVDFNSSFVMDINNKPMELYTLSIKNRGVRPVTINSLYIKGNNSNLFINLMQSKFIEYKSLPTNIQPEECVDYYFDAKEFREELTKMTQKKFLKKNQKLIVFAQDSLGDKYCHNTKTKIGKLIK